VTSTVLEGADDGPGRWGDGRAAGRDGDEFAQMIGAFRLLQERITGSVPPRSTLVEMTRVFGEFAATLEPFTVPERQQVTGHRIDLPGRGQALVPAFHADLSTDHEVRGRFTFSRYYLGGNGAAHGGTIPLIFDEVLGRLANAGGRPLSRTAYLNIDFRSITPIGVELRLEARFDREEGRKRFLSARIHHGDVLTAEAEGLFVALRPGQP
jgi:acyl-coenzyme A thioesterase PaaI-like protein